MFEYYKKVGLTTNEIILDIKKKYNFSENDKIACPGKLDPMAEGKMIVLLGDECLNMKKFCSLNKTYNFDLILGISTDTGDVLGKIQNTSNIKNLNIESITKYILNITKYNQKFPDYSAIKVDGKPLWWWSNNNKLNEIENKRPTKEINIFNINLEKIELITLDNLAYNSINKINKINSKENFRQNEIINLWKDYLTNNNYIYIINMTARVSSGTYIRQLCIDIGNYFNIPSMADNINRLNIHLD